MKLESVKNLYLVKQMVAISSADGVLKKRIQELVNIVLMTEVGSKGVLYPYNGMEDSIMELWQEHTPTKDIASKLDIDEECVLCVIEEKGGIKEV